MRRSWCPKASSCRRDLSSNTSPEAGTRDTLHVGPYEQLGDVWARFLGEWVPASGNRIGDGVSYEIYTNNPGRCRSRSFGRSSMFRWRSTLASMGT